MPYSPYYSGGWQDSPATATPVTAAALQNIESGLQGASNWYNWRDIGIKPDGGATDNGPIINNFLKSLWNSGAGQGGVIVLPQCGFQAGGNTSVTTYSTIVIPPFCGLIGMGKQKTMIRLGPGANCDVIQPMQYNSSSQATLLSVTATTLQNCFYGRLEGLTVHGSWNYQTPGSYFHGINITTNPATSATGSDPDFDPYILINDVECRYASGDGLYHLGRGGLQVTNFLARYNQGNGATVSFDSLYEGIDLGFNGITGLYQNHGSTSGSGKIYNNGTIPQWVSGGTYTYNSGTGSMSMVMYSGNLYACKLSVTGSATTPAADTTHWAAVTATSPQAWGYDGYWDSNAYEAVWRIDSQEPTAGSFYLKQATGITLNGVSNRPNFDNPGTGARAGSNPNSYAAVTLDGAVGCNVDVAYNDFGSVAYALKTLNSPSHCNVLIAGDTSAQGNSTGTLTGNYVVINGSVLSGGGSGSGIAQAAATAAAGFSLANSTGDIIAWTAPSDGNLHTAFITAMLSVTSGTTGGQVTVTVDLPGNAGQTWTLFSAGQSTGNYGFANGGPQMVFPVAPGGTVTISQWTAMTAGAAKVYATIAAA